MGLPNQDEYLFFDLAELNRADQTALNAVMSVLVERYLGDNVLGPNVLVVADMNPPDGAYAVTSSFSTDPAIRRRTCQIAVNFSAAEFLRWAKDPSIGSEFPYTPLREALEAPGTNKTRPLHSSVVEFLQSNVDLALDNTARAAGKVYGCPASWHACSDTLYTIERLKLPDTDPLLALAIQAKLGGHVGAVNARNLLEYHQRAAAALQPRDLLLSFAAKDSPVRNRVKKLLDDGYVDRIAGALNNMAIVWAEGVDRAEFTSQDVAPHMAAIFEMVPLDLGAQLLDAIVAADDAAGGSNGPTMRSTTLVRYLHQEPAFVKFRDRRGEALAEKQRQERAATD
jgi:DNA-binding Lrp family transcriptional regulator